uniref:Cilia- and flagella-associated protein 418 n=1 Tax=Arion vulgaris TaxID=1028688 RepID=A0A0B7A4D8_9EUPU
MERDINDLLDEVERKFINNPKKSAASASLSQEKQNSTAKSRSKTPTKLSNALDDVIDDILDIDVSEERHANSNFGKDHHLRSLASDEMCKSDQVRRCFPVFLGGSENNMGRSSAANNKACDQLRCTSCDFKVYCYDNLSWNKDTDYLFLRNNVPNFHKLKIKLCRLKGKFDHLVAFL